MKNKTNIIYFSEINSRGTISKYAIFNDIKFIKNKSYYRALKNDKCEAGDSLHNVVYEYYYTKIPNGYVIHHIDFNKDNNDISNLQMLSNSDHVKLHHEKGTFKPLCKEKNGMYGNGYLVLGSKNGAYGKFGKNHPTGLKLSTEQEQEIINLYINGMSVLKISKKFNISRSPVTRILIQNDVYVKR